MDKCRSAPPTQERVEPHTLIIGGTGMLKAASIELAKRSRLLTSVARTAISLQTLDQELHCCSERHYTLQLDWSDAPAFLDALDAHCSVIGYPSLVVAWAHRDDLGPRIAARISSKNGRFFHVRSSAAADPTQRFGQLAEAAAVSGAQYHQIILGFQATSTGSRWLDNSEISSGVLNAIDRGERKAVVGVVAPWADRP